MRKWLRWWFFGVIETPVVTLPQVGSPTEIAEAEWRNQIDIARMVAYQQGLAVGEYRGRLALAREVEAEFAAKPITEEDAKRIVLKQTH